MEKSFDKKLKVKIYKDKQSVSISIRVSDDMVSVFKTTINEFNIMVAEYEGQLYEAHQEDSVENEII